MFESTSNPKGKTLNEMIAAANDWCQEHQITPISGVVGETITIRNVRYYQSLGLVDRTENGPKGYGDKHFLQMIAIRVLQARGLPLSKIQSLLYGRSMNDLKEIQRRAKEEAIPRTLVQRPSGDWQLHVIHDGLLLLSREIRLLSPEQKAQIAAILTQAAQVEKS